MIWKREKYEVRCDNARIASDMYLQDALLLIEAYFNKYYNERNMILSIKEMEEVTNND